MVANQKPLPAQFNQTTSNKDIFGKSISSYIPEEPDISPSPAIEEEVLTDYFISKYGLTLEQINHDLAICRELEGDK